MTNNNIDAAWRKYLAGCAAGDRTALARLYDESSRLVYSLALKIVGNVAEAEQVTVDVYNQVWNGAAFYDVSRGGVRSWLVMLARSGALDRLRSRPWPQRRETILDDFDFCASLEGPSEEAERRGRIAAAMHALSAEQREVILLALFQGLTQTELAERLNQPLDVVKTRIRGGMLKLREHMEPVAA